jgi:hypothetical protein
MSNAAAFDRIRERIVRVKGAPAVAAAAAAPRILAKLRADATTRRGNVPSYGEMGNIPIAVEALPEAIVVRGPDWVLRKAAKLGQVDEWADIVREEAARALRSAVSGGTR